MNLQQTDAKKLVIIALGSNLGDREHSLKSGIELLKQHISIKKTSKYHYSKALLPDNAPAEWDIDYCNCVLFGYTSRNPFELLDICQKIEIEVAGQKRDKQKWSPRVLDIDIIAYEGERIDTDNLKIPHPLMLERGFVMKPLLEILPDWENKIYKK